MSSLPTERTIEVTLPDLANDVLEAIVVAWEKHPGDWVEHDEPICIVSADGLRAAVASSASGYLVRLLAGVGARIGPGTSLAEIAAVEPESGGKGAPEARVEAEDDTVPAPDPEPESAAEGTESEPEESTALADLFSPFGDRAAPKPPALAPPPISSLHSPHVRP